MHRSHRFETRRASIPSPHRPTWRRLYAPLLLAALPGCLSDACSHFAEDFVGGLACQASADIGNSRLQDVVDDALTMERRALGPVQFAIVVDRGRALTKHDPLPDDANGCARMREQQGGRALYDLSACARFQGLLLVDDGGGEAYSLRALGVPLGLGVSYSGGLDLTEIAGGSRKLEVRRFRGAAPDPATIGTLAAFDAAFATLGTVIELTSTWTLAPTDDSTTGVIAEGEVEDFTQHMLTAPGAGGATGSSDVDPSRLDHEHLDVHAFVLDATCADDSIGYGTIVGAFANAYGSGIGSFTFARQVYAGVCGDCYTINVTDSSPAALETDCGAAQKSSHYCPAK